MNVDVFLLNHTQDIKFSKDIFENVILKVDTQLFVVNILK